MNEKLSEQINEIFFNNKGRLRSGWRVLFFIITLMFIASILSELSLYVLRFLPEWLDISGGLIARIFESSLGLFLAIFLGWLCGRLFEDLPFRALGAWFTKFWFKDFVLGCLIGIASITLAVSFAIAFGGLRFQFNQSAGISAIQVTLLFSFIVFFIGAAFEEALVRGYIFQTFVRADLAWVAILITSSIFAFGHITNPNAEVFSTINTALAGIWLGIAYLKTRTLWFAFGIHLGWNWFQGSILGIEVSGLTDLSNAPLLTEIDRGPNWISGGDYGIEGGIACTIALIASTIIIWYLPFLKPTEEMLELTSKEKSVNEEV